MAYLGLARKYRPQTFSDLIGQEIVVKVLQNSLKTNKISHAYIFSGPKGVGKTSTARILSKALNCLDSSYKPCDKCPSCISIRQGKAMSVIEIDAASHTSVENIRELRENVHYASADGYYKVYIIDEAHMLSQAAFNAFLKTLEEPPHHVVFVLATTEPRKIPLTVLSRCQHLQFRRIPTNLIKERLKFICEQEHIKAQQEALHLIAINSEGSMRDAITLLDQLSSFSDDITVDDLNLLLGSTDIEVLYEITENLISGNKEGLIKKIDFLNDIGTDFKIFIKDLILFIRNALVAKITGNIFNVSESHTKIIEKLSRTTSEEHLILILKELISAEVNIKGSFFPRIIFEITLLKLSLLSHFRAIDESIGQLKKIELKDFKDEKISTFDNLDKGSYESAKQHNYCEEELTEIWSKFLDRLEEKNHILANKIKHAEIEFNDKEIILIYNGGAVVYSESVKESIQEIQEELNKLGSDIRVSIKERASEKVEKKDLRDEVLNNHLVKQTLQLFDGRLCNIIQKKGGNNNV